MKTPKGTKAMADTIFQTGFGIQNSEYLMRKGR
jgi:hypothetical protein